VAGNGWSMCGLRTSAHLLGLFEHSVVFYKLAIEMGDADAHGMLGSRYRSGFGVPKDPGKAARLFEGGALRCDPISMYWLGLMLSEGEHVQEDLPGALAWFALSCRAPLPHSPALSARNGLVERMTPAEERDGRALADLLFHRYRRQWSGHFNTPRSRY
jgi:TPR repeat protein